MPPEQLTVIIPAFNNAETLPELLTEVSWADEILVVDSFSTDGTVALAQQYKARVIQHEYINSAKQKNWAIPQCAHAWVFLIDTDEHLPADLQEEIQGILTLGAPIGVDAYRVARKTVLLGRWLKTMDLWPDYQTRLFRRDVSRYADKEVHSDVIVPGRVLTLKNSLTHVATPSLSKQIGLLDRYSRYQADELEKLGIRFNWFNLLLRPPAIFLHTLFWRRGFTEGFRGLFVAFHKMSFSFFTHAKLWEKEWRAGHRT